MTKRVSVRYLITLIILLSNVVCFAEEQEALYRARLSVCSLVEEGKFDEAKTATDILIAEFKTYSGLPESLYWIAERYDRQEKYETAVSIWQQVINDYPGNPLINKAKLSISRANILSLISSENYDQAKEAIEKFIADFAGHPDLPEALYWIATKYERQNKFDDAKTLYERLSRDYSYSPWADKARLAIGCSDIKSFIISKQYDPAQSALEKFASDFASSPDLAEALYWISKLYELQNRPEGIKQCHDLLQNIPANIYSRKAKLDETKANIISLIEAGSFTAAGVAVDKMTVDFINHRDLPETLFWLAERYQRFDRFVEAKNVYQTITGNFRDTIWADKSKLWLSRITVLSLLVSKDYDGAKSAIDKFIANFANNPELPEALFWIAERFQREDRFEQAAQIYQKIINDYPNRPFANKSKFWLARVNVISLIVSQDYTAAKAAFDKFVLDFSSNPDLPETLFWLAERYQRQNKSEEASLIEQQITTSWPDSPFAGKTPSNIAQASAASLIEAPASNESSANTNIIEVSQEQQQKAAELYALAREYETLPERSADVRPMYERIIKEYPGTVKANNAVLDIRRLEIWEKIKSGELAESNILIDKFISDYKANPYAADSFFNISEKCFSRAIDLHIQNQEILSQDYFTLSEIICQKLLDNLPCDRLKIYFHIARCLRKQNNLFGAIEYFQKVVDDYPDSEFFYTSNLAIISCYEQLRDSNAIPKEEINPLIEESYKELLGKYPINAGNREILIKLGWLTFHQDRLQEAISFFEHGLAKYSDGSKPVDALYALGCYYEKTGNIEKAVKTYEELLKLLPGNTPQNQSVQQKLSQINGTITY